MHTVYALFSKDYNKIYIGITSDLEKRLFTHNNLPKGWTAKFRPWIIIYTEEFDSKKEALQREKQLKSARGREFIWKMINTEIS
ncbi:GIY-YIG nuclease family protein [uncultured Draconibacterium sp.]|uniref:GIY-YIG nuclease family protein n=1 Tax=uncultured Draconibacterium sp. TaxID=1573823 RepID=UPI002AA930AE|nr:GIY-YIG nuclease family protein [uncultured Draconibacterium sp.]